MQLWRMGIIGCGWAGAQHARAIRTLGERAALVAVADTRIDAAADLARAYDVSRMSQDYRELLAADDIDAVCVCVPHQLHAPVAIDAARAGKHILVEKPLAASLGEADAMIASAQRANVQLMVAENVRFDETYRRVAILIQQGAIGQPSLIRIAREHQLHDYLRQRPWFLTDSFAGIMASGGVHDFELLRMLAGDVEHVYGLVAPKSLAEMQADDTSVAVAQMKSGVAALLVESFSLRTQSPGIHGTAHGSEGSLWFHGDTIRRYAAVVDGQADAVETIVVQKGDTFIAEMTHFLDCLDTGDEAVTNGREERAPLAAVLAVYESFRRGTRVYVGV